MLGSLVNARRFNIPFDNTNSIARKSDHSCGAYGTLAYSTKTLGLTSAVLGWPLDYPFFSIFSDNLRYPRKRDVGRQLV